MSSAQTSHHSIPHWRRTLAWASASSADDAADAMQARTAAMLGDSRNMSSILKRGKAANSNRRWRVSAGEEAPAVTRRVAASTMSARASPVHESEGSSEGITLRACGCLDCGYFDVCWVSELCDHRQLQAT